MLLLSNVCTFSFFFYYNFGYRTKSLFFIKLKFTLKSVLYLNVLYLDSCTDNMKEFSFENLLYRMYFKGESCTFLTMFMRAVVCRSLHEGFLCYLTGTVCLQPFCHLYWGCTRMACFGCLAPFCGIVE